MVDSIIRIELLIGSLMAVFLFAETVGHHDVFSDLWLPITVAIAAWVLLALRELISWVKRFYFDLQDPWDFPEWSRK